MKKYIIVLLGILLVGCCSADQQNSEEGVLIKKTLIQAHHTENCPGHEFYLGRIDFIDEGHDMWLYFKDASGANVAPSSGFTIVHSPKCRLCHPEEESNSQETTTTSTSDYWGW